MVVLWGVMLRSLYSSIILAIFSGSSSALRYDMSMVPMRGLRDGIGRWNALSRWPQQSRCGMRCRATTQGLVADIGLTYGRLGFRESVFALWCSTLVAMATWSRKRAVALSLIRGVAVWLVSRETLRELRKPPSWQDSLKAVGAYVDVGAFKCIHAIESGSRGASIVKMHCSHGFGANSLSFSAMLDALPEARAIAHDHPGFGLTKRPSRLGDYVLSGEVAAALAPDSACFVGHSMGAIAALDATVRRNVTRLVLIAPALSTRRSSRIAAALVAPLARIVSSWPVAAPTRFLLRRLVHTSPTFWRDALGLCWSRHSRTSQPDALARVSSGYSLPSYLKGWDIGLVKFAASRLLNAGPRDADLVEIAKTLSSLRILIIHGELDRVVPISKSRALQAAFGPSATLVSLPDVGHCPHEERPDQVATAIRHFLKV